MKPERFEECYRKYRDRVIAYVMREVCEEYLAEDICQNVFERFYLNQDTILPEAEWVWLIRCAGHMIADHRRSASYRRDVELDYFDPSREKPASEDTEDRAVRELDDIALLRLVFSELREHSRSGFEAFYILYVEEFSYEEAAELLQVSVPVLRMRAFRAKKYVNVRFREMYEGLIH